MARSQEGFDELNGDGGHHGEYWRRRMEAEDSKIARVTRRFLWFGMALTGAVLFYFGWFLGSGGWR